MSQTSRIVIVIAALLGIAVYFLPIWSITLYAPQYSDGIGFYILVDDLQGHSKNDIQNVNILNHYIGMRPIEVEDFPEFQYMPWVFGALIGLGLIVGLVGNKWLLVVWVLYFILIGVVGMIRFYYWGYEYGHDLDPRAPIKVPGMTYQPPMIGSKQLLNITAHSWPASASYFLGASLIMGLFLVYLEFFHKSR